MAAKPGDKNPATGSVVKDANQYGKAMPAKNSFMKRMEAAGKDPKNNPKLPQNSPSAIAKIFGVPAPSVRTKASDSSNTHPDFGNVGSKTGKGK